MKIPSLNFYGLFCTSLLFASPKPNIVHIMVDDLGWQDIASHKVDGNTVYETPHLDKLTRTGRRFTEAYAPSPCMCTFKSIFFTWSIPS